MARITREDIKALSRAQTFLDEAECRYKLARERLNEANDAFDRAGRDLDERRRGLEALEIKLGIVGTSDLD